MTRPVGPVGSSGAPGLTPGVPAARDDERRLGDRRSGDRRGPSRRKAAPEADKTEPGRDLVPVGDRMDHDTTARREPRPADPTQADAAFAAQIMGQQGQKRGLRGGAPVLDAARTTYLKAEYVGEKDRRPAAGSVKKTEL